MAGSKSSTSPLNVNSTKVTAMILEPTFTMLTSNIRASLQDISSQPSTTRDPNLSRRLSWMLPDVSMIFVCSMLLSAFAYKVHPSLFGKRPLGDLTVKVSPGATTAGSTIMKVKSSLLSSRQTTRASSFGLIVSRSAQAASTPGEEKKQYHRRKIAC